MVLRGGKGDVESVLRSAGEFSFKSSPKGRLNNLTYLRYKSRSNQNRSHQDGKIRSKSTF